MNYVFNSCQYFVQVQKKKFTADTTVQMAPPQQRITPQKSPLPADASLAHDLSSKSHDALDSQTNSNNSHDNIIGDTKELATELVSTD